MADITTAMPRGEMPESTFKDRLKSWWHGSAGEPLLAPEPESVLRAAQQAERAGPKPGDPLGWQPERVHAMAWLFGEGADMPDGARWFRDLIVPFGLREAHGAVVMRAGTGLAVRVMAREFGAYVDAFESRPALADEQDRLNRKAGLSRRVTLFRSDFAQARVRPQSRDAAFGWEALSFERDKYERLAELTGLLRPGAQLVLVELARKTTQTSTADIRELNALEPNPLVLETTGNLKTSLVQLGYDVRIVEEITDSFVQRTAAALMASSERLKGGRVPRAERDWVIWEAEYWARRVTALRGGDVGLYRYYARLPEADPFATARG